MEKKSFVLSSITHFPPKKRSMEIRQVFEQLNFSKIKNKEIFLIFMKYITFIISEV